MAAYPEAEVHASRAIDGALTGFLRESRARSEAYIQSSKASAEEVAEIRRGHATIDKTDVLRPTVPGTSSGESSIAGRTLQLKLAPYRSEEHTSELQSLMRTTYDGFYLEKIQ